LIGFVDFFDFTFCQSKLTLNIFPRLYLVKRLKQNFGVM